MRAKAKEVKLLKKCLEGDATAFEVIVAEYQDLICAITYSGVADIHRSEELAHQTFINAWTKLSQLKDLSKFRPWLCTIARNHVISFIREKKRDILQKAKPMEHVNGRAADESGPLESVIKKEHIELVDAAIGQMPELYREPLVLFYRQGQSVKQVARSLDLSQGAVKQRLRRGREMVKGQLSSIVEETLSATGPKKAFTAAVSASIAGLAVKSGVAAAAGVAGASAAASTPASVATIMGGMSAKIIVAAAVIAIGVGAVAYKTINNTDAPEPPVTQTSVIPQQEVTANDVRPAIAIESVEKKSVADQQPEIVEKQPTPEPPVEQVPLSEKPSPQPSAVENSEAVQSTDDLIVGGIVQTEGGKPIADVEVKLLWNVIRGGMQMFDGSDAVTDPDGRWQCQITGESEDIQIRLKHSDHLAMFFNYRPSIEDLFAKTAVLAMRKGIQLFGSVHDPEGNPIFDALIMPPNSITSTDAVYGIQDSAKSTRTDENGFFLLMAVKPGLQDIAIDCKGYAPTFFEVDVATDTPAVDITLDYGKILTGVVVDNHGQPLSGVKVIIDDWKLIQGKGTVDFRYKGFKMLRRRTFTDDSGSYTIEHLPSIGEVPVYFGKKPLLSSSLEKNMDQDETEDIAMYPVPTITGTVIDADTEKPITEFEVIRGFTWDPNEVGSWRLNTKKIVSSDGKFSKTIRSFVASQPPMPGSVAVRINAKGYLQSQTPWMLIDKEFLPITVRLKKAQVVSSTLFYSDGTAASDTDVILMRPSSRLHVNHGKLQEGFSNSTYTRIETDSNGYFEFPMPSEPTRILVLDYDEYLIADTGDIKEKMTLMPWAYVSGVVDIESESNSNVRVQIETQYDPNEPIQWYSQQTTNIDGSFEFFYIPGIPQKIHYGPVDSKRQLEINPHPGQELKLRLSGESFETFIQFREK